MPQGLEHVLLLLGEPFLYVLNPHKRIFWLYLLSALLLALAVVIVRRQSVATAAAKCLSLRYWFGPSSLVDYQWIVINHILRVILIVPLIGGQLAFALMTNRGLTTVFGEGDYLLWPSAVTAVLFTLVLFVLDDFSRFFVHVLYHRVPLLWRFHAIHHSASQLTPLTLYRIHSVEMMINSCRSVLVLGTVSGVFIFLFDGTIGLFEVAGVSIFNALFNLAGANLRHSHVWLGYGFLEKCVISPAQHQIHHSVAAAHIDKNYGSMLSVWDRMFGSWVASKGQQVERFGISGKTVEQSLRSQWLGV